MTATITLNAAEVALLLANRHNDGPDEQPNAWQSVAAKIEHGDDTHQGFSNYETFALGVYIDNDRALFMTTIRLANSARRRSARPAVDRTAAGILADELHQRWEARCPDDLPSPFGSLLWAAFGQVDWYDLAEHYLRTAAEVPA